MGMAASQARLLTLQARQSDLEYQGQQINQERSVLSQQVTSLYNSLLTMSVPTPPSTTDYTTVQYSGTIGATAYSFDASSVKPCKKVGDQQTYYVTVKQSAYGDSLNKNPNISVVNNSVAGHISCVPETTQVHKTNDKGEELYWTTTQQQKKDATGNPLYYAVDEDGNKIDPPVETTTPSAFKVMETVSIETTEANNTPIMQNKQYTASDIASFYVLNTDNTVTKAKPKLHFDSADGKHYTIKSEFVNKLLSVVNGYGTVYPVQGAVDGTTVDGHPVFKKDDFQTEYSLTQEQMNSYSDAVAHSGLIKPNGKPYTIEEFYMYFNDDGEACFALISDVDDNNDNTVTYSYIANGDYSKSTTYADSKLTFDPTSGRITSISIPNYDASGNISSYSTMEVAAASISDDLAYEDAYNKYEYEKYQYDKKQQEINAQTEIIQQMDRNLELKLQRLDNEREQITNEVEALDKVISENIQGSYKTFSG